jgi:hypothetical protein
MKLGMQAASMIAASNMIRSRMPRTMPIQSTPDHDARGLDDRIRPVSDLELQALDSIIGNDRNDREVWRHLERYFGVDGAGLDLAYRSSQVLRALIRIGVSR